MKKLPTKTVAILLFIFICIKTNAQTFPYSSVAEMDTYTELTNTTELTSIGDLWDDPAYIVPIGFDFEFYGEMYDKIYFFGLGAMFSFKNVGLVDSLDLVAAYIDDIADIEKADGTMQSTISYVTEGAVGERIFKIEWKNVGFLNEIDSLGTIENRASFQVWLYEANYNIEFRYGPHVITNPDLVHDFGNPTCGIVNNAGTNTNINYTFWYLTGEVTDPILTSADTVAIYSLGLQPLSTHPDDGQVYRLVNLGTATTTPTPNIPVKVYPNLVSNEFFVEIDEAVLEENTQLFLINNLGQKVWGKTFTNEIERVNISHFPKGIYYLMVVNEKGRSTRKILKK